MIIDLQTTDDFFAAFRIPSGIREEYRREWENGRRLIGSLRSSYSKHQYDEVFYALARIWQPRLYLELGVLSGYSLLAATLALRQNGSGRSVGIDLFEQYEFNKDYQAAVQKRVDDLHLGEICTLIQGSAFDAQHQAMRPDILHVDLSNHGEIVRKIFDGWRPSVTRAVLFEGGSEARDRIPWMMRLQKQPMRPVFEQLADLPDLRVYQIRSFPSLTLVLLTPDA